MYNNMKNILFVLFFCFFIHTPFVNAKTDSEIENAIQTELSNRHPSDTGEFWLGLGTHAPQIIIQQYQVSQNPYHRTRLLAGLGFFPQDIKALEFLKEQAEKTNESIIRTTAIRSIAHSQGEKEIEFLSQFLASNDPQTRLATAQALKKLDSTQIKNLLDNYLQSEKIPWIKDQIQNTPTTPIRTLSIASSNEDLVSPHFHGTWKGFFITSGSGKTGLKSQKISLVLTTESNRILKGKIEFISKNKTKLIVPFSKLEGNNDTIVGQIQLPSTLSLNKKNQTTEFEGKLTQESENFLLKINFKSTSGIIILQKEI